MRGVSGGSGKLHGGGRDAEVSGRWGASLLPVQGPEFHGPRKVDAAPAQCRPHGWHWYFGDRGYGAELAGRSLIVFLDCVTLEAVFVSVTLSLVKVIKFLAHWVLRRAAQLFIGAFVDITAEVRTVLSTLLASTSSEIQGTRLSWRITGAVQVLANG